MTTAFAQAFDSGLDALYDAMGEGCRYTDKDGWKRDCSVIVERDLAEYADVANVQGKTAVISVRVSEVPDRPRREETFELEATCEILTVDSIVRSNEFEHVVLCT